MTKCAITTIPLNLYVGPLTKKKIVLVNDLLLSSDWSTLNKCDVNIAFKEYQNITDKCLDSVAQMKQIKIPSHRVWHEPWITKGLSRSMDKCIKLYRLSIGSNTMPEIENKYKSYRNCLVRVNKEKGKDWLLKQMMLRLKIYYKTTVATYK